MVAKSVSPKLWLLWLLPLLFAVFQFCLQGVVGVLAPQMKESLNIDATMVALISSSFYYTYIVMQIPVGLIFDLVGLRIASTCAISLVAISCFFLGRAATIEEAMAARMLMGLGCSFAFIGVMLASKAWFGLERFAVMATMIEFFSMVGVGCMNIMISGMATSFGWRWTFYALAAVLLLLAGLFVWKVRDGVSEQVTVTYSKRELFRELVGLVWVREIWLGGIASGLVFATFSVFVALWAVPFLVDCYGLDLVQASSVVSLTYIGCALMSPIYGWLVRYYPIKRLIAVGAGLTLPFLTLLIYGPRLTIGHLYGLMFAIGMSCAVYQLSFVLVAQKVGPKVQGSAIGMTNMVIMVVAPIVQPGVGILLSWAKGVPLGEGFESYSLSDYRWALSLLPIGLVVTIYLCSFLREGQEPLGSVTP